MKDKFNLAILTNERPDDHELWVKACEERKNELTYKVIDLTSSGWYAALKENQFDYLLTKPGCQTNAFKQLYDERLQILTKELRLKAFPTFEEVQIYENKRFFSFWLSANDIPHPRTEIFYNKTEAKKYLENQKFPVVAKLNIGASGSGVVILRDDKAAEKYINEIFGTGKSSRVGPNLSKGRLLKRFLNKLKDPAKLKQKLKIYSAIASDIQKGFVILQEYIAHTYEWRVVRIGNSFFAHKKLLNKEKASGSLLKGYENPPLQILDFAKQITDKFKFYSQAVDIFEVDEGKYLINEMQCIFGQSDPYQMLVDGKPGRYIFENGNWIFEEGSFNQNESYNLRLDYVLNELKRNQNS